MRISDLKMKSSMSDMTMEESKQVYLNMREKEAISLRHKVLEAMTETYVAYMQDEGHSGVEIQDAFSEVVEGLIKDDRVTVVVGDHLKSMAMNFIYRHNYKDMLVNSAVKRIADTKVKDLPVMLVSAMESLAADMTEKEAMRSTEAGANMAGMVLYIVSEYQSFFPESFMSKL